MQQTINKDRITDPAEQLRLLTTSRSSIRLEILVHEGTFGRIYKGVFKRGDTYEEVMVKTVSGKLWLFKNSNQINFKYILRNIQIIITNDNIMLVSK